MINSLPFGSDRDHDIHRTSIQNHIFYERSQRPPYLEATSDEIQARAKSSANNINPSKRNGSSTKSKDGNNSKRNEEADTAAGGMGQTNSVLKRVSSFNLMTRSMSSNNTASQGQTRDKTPKKSPAPRSRTSHITNSAPTARGSDLMVGGGHAYPRSVGNNSSGSFAGESSMAGTAGINDTNGNGLAPSWRLRDRMKTVGVGLVMALNVGTDPPDITKPHPCAKLQCWMDPSSVTRAKAKEKIGERLEAQYARWQQQRAARPLKYRRALDPTVEDVRGLCLWLRRQARHERILLHYNGHGVPRPTVNGEIWVFDKNHTEYIPLSVTDLRQWMGKPSIVVLDCSSAGILIPFLTRAITETPPDTPPRQQAQPQQNHSDPPEMETAASNWVKDTIVLCPTSDQEWLPMHPDYPADIFTSCLTTPINIALRWFVRRNRQSVRGLNPEAVDAIPGKAIDRKTPLGELNWIFTAVTDSIAWNLFPKPLFQRLFRQDLLVASMFRNFLLADRILRSLNCTPQSYPPLPPGVADHPLWQAWDLACETCLFGLIKDGILGNHVVKPPPSVPHSSASSNVEDQPRVSGGGRDSPASSKPVKQTQYTGTAAPTQGTTGIPTTGPASSVSSPFFSEQLTAFEIWLEFASIHKSKLDSNHGSPSMTPPLEPPEQLPVVLQVLLSQVHRIRALVLLRRFLDLGAWAVNLSLRLGIFPYVMKLLQSPEYKTLLISIWASILKFDPSCQVDLVKDGALPHFIQPLTTWGANPGASGNMRGVGGGSSTEVAMDAARLRTLAAFSLAATCHDYPTGQAECLRQNLHGHCCSLLTAFQQQLKSEQQQQPPPQPTARSFKRNAKYNPGKDTLQAHQQLPYTCRLWLCVCLGNLIKKQPAAQNEAYNTNVHLCLITSLDDSNPGVRASACYALGCLLEQQTQQAETDDGMVGGIHQPSPPSPQSLSSSIYPPGSPGGSFPTGSQVLVPQHMSATTMTVPAALTASAVLSGQLQPTVADHRGGNAMWRSSQQQHRQMESFQQPGLPSQLQPHPQLQQPSMDGMHHPSAAIPQSGLHLNPIGQQQMNVSLLQTHLLRPHGQNMAPPVIVPPQQHPRGPGPGSMVNAMGSHNAAMLGSPHPPPLLMMNPMIAPPPLHQQPQQHRQSVYDDHRRLDMDLVIIEVLLTALDDASSTVRYEAMIALAQGLEKYLQAYLVVAEESWKASSTSNDEVGDEEGPGAASDDNDELHRTGIVSIPQGLSRPMLDRFGISWKFLRRIQHKDPHPNVSQAANSLVCLVNNRFFDILKESKLRTSERQRKNAQNSRDLLLGIQEEGNGQLQDDDMIPGYNIERSDSEQFLTPHRKARSEYEQDVNTARSDGPGNRSPEVKLYPLRRTSSDHGPPFGWQQSSVSHGVATQDSRNESMRISVPPGIPDPSGDASEHRKADYTEYTLPKSSFYEWKKAGFHTGEAEAEDDFLEKDPLCPSGAAKANQLRRNIGVEEIGRRLASRFVGLAPKARQSKQDWDKILEDDEEADEKDSSLKGDLKLKEQKLLRNDGVKLTSMLKFHTYEDILMVCDDNDGISIWNYEKGIRCSEFRNGNPKGSRMTSSFWINESSRSLFFVGCDDGTARVWDGIVESNGEISRNEPLTLASAFFAVPDMEAGKRGSGLVCEWQQFSGTLIAGGNSDAIRCWDLASEKCKSIMETNTDACVTTLTTAWNSEVSTSGGHHGMGPDIVVAGQSDGILKVFDIRSPQSTATSSGHPVGGGASNRKSRGQTMYAEHGSWIVDVSFSSHGGRYEVIFGCLDGDMKAWDLRMSTSIRTLDVQRSPMTAVTVHKQIPIAATGSHAQFIKILTLEGEALQVVRVHEELSGHKIGPVSCLEFHQQKLVLAAGAANSLVSIYKPKHALLPP